MEGWLQYSGLEAEAEAWRGSRGSSERGGQMEDFEILMFSIFR